MIGNWLLGAMQGPAKKSAEKEVRRFIEGLRRTADRDMGVIVGIAAVIRINMEIHGVIPERIFQTDTLPSANDLGVMQMRINEAARQFTKMRQAADATGAMIWSYSLRCLNVAELRPLGRELWGELKRGFPHAEEALDEGQERIGKPFEARVWEEWSMIPLGLEPEE
ncbi:MAG: hypothetical protein HN403_01010 [Rhodospirillales bacterium]|jgi:hypothetical protein|nr:hypothetical protein [Rhodospirillales bacterium]